MDYPWAVPGQKVVCISDDFYDITSHGRKPMVAKGEVVTIRDAIVHPANNKLCLVFAEKPDTHAYSAAKFRPLVSERDDIALFTRIAQDASHRISEDV